MFSLYFPRSARRCPEPVLFCKQNGTGPAATAGNTQPPPRSPALSGGGEPRATSFYRKKWNFREGRYFLNVTQHTGAQNNTCSSDKRAKEIKPSLQSPFWEPTLLFPHLVSLHGVRGDQDHCVQSRLPRDWPCRPRARLWPLCLWFPTCKHRTKGLHAGTGSGDLGHGGPGSPSAPLRPRCARGCLGRVWATCPVLTALRQASRGISVPPTHPAGRDRCP